MSDEIKKDEGKRTVVAPAPTSVDGSGSVLSVEVGVDEEVRWQWTHGPNGQSLVTGYEIIKRADNKS